MPAANTKIKSLFNDPAQIGLDQKRAEILEGIFWHQEAISQQQSRITKLSENKKEHTKLTKQVETLQKELEAQQEALSLAKSQITVLTPFKEHTWLLDVVPPSTEAQDQSSKDEETELRDKMIAVTLALLSRLSQVSLSEEQTRQLADSFLANPASRDVHSLISSLTRQLSAAENRVSRAEEQAAQHKIQMEGLEEDFEAMAFAKKMSTPTSSPGGPNAKAKMSPPPEIEPLEPHLLSNSHQVSQNQEREREGERERTDVQIKQAVQKVEADNIKRLAEIEQVHAEVRRKLKKQSNERLVTCKQLERELNALEKEKNQWLDLKGKLLVEAKSSTEKLKRELASANEDKDKAAREFQKSKLEITKLKTRIKYFLNQREKQKYDVFPVTPSKGRNDDDHFDLEKLSLSPEDKVKTLERELKKVVKDKKELEIQIATLKKPNKRSIIDELRQQLEEAQKANNGLKIANTKLQTKLRNKPQSTTISKRSPGRFAAKLGKKNNKPDSPQSNHTSPGSSPRGSSRSNELADLQLEHEDTLLKLSRVQDERDSLKKRLGKLEAAQEDASWGNLDGRSRGAVDTLEAEKVEELELRLASLEAEKEEEEESRAKIDEMRGRELQRVKKKKVELASELSDKEEELSVLLSEVTDLRQEAEARTEELARYKERLNAARLTEESLKATEEELQGELLAYQNALEAAQSDTESYMGAEEDKLRSKISELEEKNARDRESKAKANQRLSKAFTALSAKLSATEGEVFEAKKALKKKEERLNIVQTSHADDVAVLEAEIKTLEGDIGKLQKERAEAEMAAEAERRSSKELSITKSALELELAQARAERDELASSREATAEKLKKLKKHCKQTEEELANAWQDLGNVKASLSTKDDVVFKQQERVDELEKEKEEAEASIEKLSRELERLKKFKAEVASKEQEISTLEGKLSQELERLKKFKAEVANKEQEISTLEGKIAELEKEAEQNTKNLVTLKAVQSELHQELRFQKEQNNESKKTMQKKAERLKIAKKENAALEEQMARLEEELEDDSNHRNQQASKKMQAQQDELSRAKSQLQHLKKENRYLSDTNEQLVSAAEASDASGRSEVSDLSQKQRKLKKEVAQLRQSLQKTEAAKAELEEKVMEYMDAKQNNDQDDDMAMLVVQQANLVSEKESQLRRKEEENEDLRNQLEKITEKNDDLSEQLSVISGSIEKKYKAQVEALELELEYSQQGGGHGDSEAFQHLREENRMLKLRNNERASVLKEENKLLANRLQASEKDKEYLRQINEQLGGKARRVGSKKGGTLKRGESSKETIRNLEVELKASREEVKTLTSLQEWHLDQLVETKVKYADVCTKVETLTLSPSSKTKSTSGSPDKKKSEKKSSGLRTPSRSRSKRLSS